MFDELPPFWVEFQTILRSARKDPPRESRYANETKLMRYLHEMPFPPFWHQLIFDSTQFMAGI